MKEEKKVVHRTYAVWNFEKELNWLNDMSRQGWALARASIFRYEFHQAVPGRYQYQLQLTNGIKQEYLDFLRDVGIECVGRCLNWIYLRRESDGTPFELFSDLDSVIRHLDRVLGLCVAVVGINLLAAISGLLSHSGFWPLNLGLAAFVGLSSLSLLRRRQVLRRQRDMRE